MKISWQLMFIIITALVCITGLEIYALHQGINGVVLTAAIGALVAIPSWFVSKKITEKKAKNGN